MKNATQYIAVFGYARFTEGAQIKDRAKEFSEIFSQLKDIKNYCKKYRFSNFQFFADTEKEKSFLKRAGFSELIGRVIKSKAERKILLCTSPDRITRNSMLMLFKIISKYNLELMFTRNNEFYKIIYPLLLSMESKGESPAIKQTRSNMPQKQLGRHVSKNVNRKKINTRKTKDV